MSPKHKDNHVEKDVDHSEVKKPRKRKSVKEEEEKKGRYVALFLLLITILLGILSQFV